MTTNGTNAKMLTVVGSRPDDVPAGWHVFNAPRPLYGCRTWEGEFRHGIFYALIDPSDRYAPQQLKDNVSLDGWLLRYVSEAEVREWATRYYAEYGISLAEVDERDIQTGYFQNEGVKDVVLV